MERNIDTSGILMMTYPNFQALCVCAKDCKGNAGTIIQGIKGCIKTSFPPNIIGSVTLECNAGTKDSFNQIPIKTRLIPEFKAFIQLLIQIMQSFGIK